MAYRPSCICYDTRFSVPHYVVLNKDFLTVWLIGGL